MPVIAGGKAYQFGYYGTTDDLKALVCFDASSGDVLWQRHSDFISDIVYNADAVAVLRALKPSMVCLFPN